jgi:hypothetical protein
MFKTALILLILAFGFTNTSSSQTLRNETFGAIGSQTLTLASGLTTLSNTAVIGQVLTVYSAAAGTVAAKYNSLQGVQKVDGNVAAASTGKQNTLTNSAGLASVLK